MPSSGEACVDSDSLGSDAACRGFVYLFSFFIRFILPLVMRLALGLCLNPHPLQLSALFYLFESDTLSENSLYSEPAASLVAIIQKSSI